MMTFDLEKGHSNGMLCCFLSVKLKDGASQSALMEKMGRDEKWKSIRYRKIELNGFNFSIGIGSEPIPFAWDQGPKQYSTAVVHQCSEYLSMSEIFLCSSFPSPSIQILLPHDTSSRACLVRTSLLSPNGAHLLIGFTFTLLLQEQHKWFEET